MKTAVLIPCYNEEKTIGKVVSDALHTLPDATVFVYDNNSTDASAQIARDAGAIVRREHQQGKGNVIRRMFREIDADCYLMIDGDDTYPLESAAEMARQVLEEGADMVVGDRLSSTYFKENKRPFHNSGNALVRHAINRLFRCDIRDIMTGYRAFSYDFVKTFPVMSAGFEIETEMTIHAVTNNMQIANVVVDYRDRPEGSVSKLNTFSDGSKVLATIFRLYRDYKPMGFFTVVASILTLLAVAFAIPVFVEYWKTGLVPRIPTLLVCGFTMIAALQSFFTGVILSGMAINNRRTFEYRRNQLAILRGAGNTCRDNSDVIE